MKTITIKQFQKNIYKELEDLPLVVTRLKKPLFVVTLFDEKVATTPKVVTSKPKKVATMKSPKIDDDFQCKHGIALDQRCIECTLG
jgi:hypothetical protein